MTTTTPHPPTTLHESTPLTLSSAESFLSAFLADASQKPNQNEIVLTNLFRVQRALAGVYVPPSPPPPVAAAAETEALTKAETGVSGAVEAGGGESGEGRADDERDKGGAEFVPVIATAEAEGVGRESRRERKARRRRREEKERKRAKKKVEKGDGSE